MHKYIGGNDVDNDSAISTVSLLFDLVLHPYAAPYAGLTNPVPYPAPPV